MSTTEIIVDQLKVCDIHLAVAREWLLSQLRAKGFEPERVDIEHDRDGWKVWLVVSGGEPFARYSGGSSSYRCERGKSLSDAFAAAARTVDAVVARNAYDAWFTLEQNQAATIGSGDAGGAPDAAPMDPDPGNGTAAVVSLQARA
jgi:hypothetical protein